MKSPSWVALLVAMGCGDNLAPVIPADAPVRPDAAPGACGFGSNPVVRRVIAGCASVGAPAPPNCIDDAITLVTSPPQDSRVFEVERGGLIRIIENDQLRAKPFIQLSGIAGGPVIDDGDEMGLLGLAFHPQFATNHTFYVFYTQDNPNTLDTIHPYLDVLARYTTMVDDPTVGDPASGEVVLAIPDPFTNHNGGMIEFGGDGLLYIGTGDGGYGGDPMGNAQNPSALLGKILRIDVDHPAGAAMYGIPPSNPYADGVAGAPEVFMLGLRNPWRWTFDRGTGDMWIADVGQSLFEELDVVRAADQLGANLGWNAYEGDSCYSPPCDPRGKVFPQVVRDHPDWFAIIGGQVYRGSCYPDLTGTYFFSDLGYGYLQTARLNDDGSVVVVDLHDAQNDFVFEPTSLHADGMGELYESDLAGDIYRIEALP